MTSLVYLFVLRPGLSSGVRSRSQTTPLKPSSPALYPALHGAPDLRDYSIISMPSETERQNSEGAIGNLGGPDSVELLIPHASQLMSALKDGLKDLSQSLGLSTVRHS